MPRFYEASDRSTTIGVVLDAGSTFIGPVNTNYPKTLIKVPKLVIICESPSYDEIKVRFPTVSSTGSRIYNHLIHAGMAVPSDKLGTAFSYDTHYREFASHGIYITNLVRYQADFAVKGAKGKKDSNVKRIWKIAANDIIEELVEINKLFRGVPVLIACGYNFYPQVKKLVRELKKLQMCWYVTNHPSRSPLEYFLHYNPINWASSSTPKTTLMEMLEFEK